MKKIVHHKSKVRYLRPKKQIKFQMGLGVFLILAVLVLAIVPNAMAYVFVGTSNLLGGQAIKAKCLAGKLGLKKISPTEWDVICNVTTTPAPTAIPTSGSGPTPTKTPTKAPTNTPTPGSGTTSMTQWHSVSSHDGLTVHEHGDAPPAWANTFSQSNFGHPVKYGGNEATPNENEMKHQAYKGFVMSASNTGGTEVYVRYHAASNPHDRSFPFHSYEYYAKDASGGVSFWQGHYFAGYPERRDQRMTRRHEVPGVDGFPGRDQFIISSPDHTDWDNYLRCEQWYTTGGLWSWDTSVTICGATTFFSYDEHHTDFANMTTWDKTGDKGGSRRLEISHYGPQNPRVGGENLPFNKWFCAEINPNENRPAGDVPTWDLTGAVAGPTSCPSGYLPQYVADSFPKVGVYFETGNTQEKSFPTTGVTLPN